MNYKILRQNSRGVFPLCTRLVFKAENGLRDLPRLVNALKKWKDIHTLDDASNGSTKPKRDSKFFLTKDSECKKRTCVYCGESTHASKDCSTVLTVSARKKVLAEKNRCFNCTGLKHRVSDSKSNINCQKCNQKHHTSICPQVVPLLTATGTTCEPLVYPVVVVNVERESVARFWIQEQGVPAPLLHY